MSIPCYYTPKGIPIPKKFLAEDDYKIFFRQVLFEDSYTLEQCFQTCNTFSQLLQQFFLTEGKYWVWGPRASLADFQNGATIIEWFDLPPPSQVAQPNKPKSNALINLSSADL